MIIYKNSTRKLKIAFSIVEIIVSIVILGFIGLAIFSIYNTIENQKEDLDNKVKSIYFSEYISEIIRKNNIPESLNIVGRPFHILEKDNEEVEFSNNPIFLNNNGGFQRNLNSKVDLFSQEIYFIEKDTINNVQYYQYEIKTSFNGNENTIYITK